MEYIAEYIENIGVNVLNFPDLTTFLLFILIIIGGFNLCMKS